MCQMSVKLPVMFDQNPPDTFDQIVKTSSRLHFLMLPVKQSILHIELSYVFLSDDRLPNTIKTESNPSSADPQ